MYLLLLVLLFVALFTAFIMPLWILTVKQARANNLV
jgi:hypothetical protein